MITRTFLVPSVLVTATALAIACGKTETTPADTSNTGVPVVTPGKSGTKDDPKSTGAKGRIAVKFKQAQSQSFSLAGEAVGTNDGAELESLSYLLSSIELFREGSLVQTGSGWTVTKPGWSLYKNAPAGIDYNAFEAEQAPAKRSLFVNFLDTAAIEKLSQDVTFSADQVGRYTAASINWYRPFFVKCKVGLSDGTTLHTRASKGFLKSGTGLDTQVKTLIHDMNQGPAEETPVMLSNGGSYSSFGSPFEITAKDVEDKAEFKLVLAYRPEGICQGFSQNSQTGGIKYANHADAALSPDKLDSVPTIQVKFLDIVPIVARKGQTVTRESYRLAVKSAVDPLGVSVLDVPNQALPFSASQRILMDVYRVGEDDFRGVNFTAMSPVGGVGTNLIAPMRPNAVSFADGKLSGTDWIGAKVVDGFTPLKDVGNKGDLTHESCTPAADMKTCATKVKVVYEAELVERTVLDAK